MKLRRLSGCVVSLVVSVIWSGLAQAGPYGRVDLGWSWSQSADIQDKNFPVDGAICGDPACATPGKINNVGDSAVLSGGVGWRFNPNWRVDATLAYRGWFKADQTMPDATNVKADVKSWSLMANAYYDFPLAWGIPYVGAGIGFASNKVDDPVLTNALFPGVAVGVPGGTTNNFAWTVMAGISKPLTPTLTLDIGARYIDLGKLETDAGIVVVNGFGVPGVTYSGAKGNLKAWELSVGLRFP